MTLIDCPWCAAAVALDPADTVVRCHDCLVEVEVLPRPTAEPDLAVAA